MSLVITWRGAARADPARRFFSPAGPARSPPDQLPTTTLVEELEGVCQRLPTGGRYAVVGKKGVEVRSGAQSAFARIAKSNLLGIVDLVDLTPLVPAAAGDIRGADRVQARAIDKMRSCFVLQPGDSGQCGQKRSKSAP